MVPILQDAVEGPPQDEALPFVHLVPPLQTDGAGLTDDFRGIVAAIVSHNEDLIEAFGIIHAPEAFYRAPYNLLLVVRRYDHRKLRGRRQLILSSFWPYADDGKKIKIKNRRKHKAAEA